MSIPNSDRDGLNALQLRQPGLQSWIGSDQCQTRSAVETLTVITHQCSDLLSVLEPTLQVLSESYPLMIRWFTRGSPISGTAMQTRKAKSAFSRPPAGFSDLVVDENAPETIPSRVDRIVLPFRQEHLDALADEDRSLLILAREGKLTPQQALEELRPLTGGLRSAPYQLKVEPFLHEGRLIVRFYSDDCTHCAAEFIGHPRDIRSVEQIVNAQYIPAASGGEGIVEYLRGRLAS